MTDDQRDSDGLPYTQVDRAAKFKAAQLGDLIGVPRQYALGALVEWWDLCGDPRDLEKLLDQGKSEVLLTPDEAKLRFRIAAGKDVDLPALVVLGLLEPRGDQYRVRGMSRYFAPLRRRVQRQAAARAGGRATAAIRRAEPLPNPCRDPAETPAEPLPNARTADSVSVSVSDQRAPPSPPPVAKKRKKEAQPDLPALPPAPPPEPKQLSWQVKLYEEFVTWRWDKAHELGMGEVEDEKPDYPFIASAVSRILANVPEADRKGRWLELLEWYFAQPWAASPTPKAGLQPTPFPFRMLASDKVWKQGLEAVEAEWAARGGAA